MANTRQENMASLFLLPRPTAFTLKSPEGNTSMVSDGLDARARRIEPAASGPRGAEERRCWDSVQVKSLWLPKLRLRLPFQNKTVRSSNVTISRFVYSVKRHRWRRRRRQAPPLQRLFHQTVHFIPPAEHPVVPLWASGPKLGGSGRTVDGLKCTANFSPTQFHLKTHNK